MRITVFCGAGTPKSHVVIEAAHTVGRAIGENHWTLVYGGSDNGVMGQLAEQSLLNQAQVLGIGTPDLPFEVWRQDLTHLEVAQNLSLRKQKMLELGDVIVILPGGIGTLDEFFEAVTLKSIGLLPKPIYLLNVEGFWDQLLMMLSRLHQQGLVSGTVFDNFRVVTSAQELIECIKQIEIPLQVEASVLAENELSKQEANLI